MRLLIEKRFNKKYKISNIILLVINTLVIFIKKNDKKILILYNK